jgi:carbon storage regulator CsrA
MLVLTRRIDEEIIIGDDIRVTVLAIQGNTVRLGFTAPRSVRIMRPEVQARPVPGAAKGTDAGSANGRGRAPVGATDGTRS